MCNFGFNKADFGCGTPVWSFYGNFSTDVPLYANVILLMDTLSQEEIDILLKHG